MKKLLVALLLTCPLSAAAATYEWVDQNGTVNFTEDLGKVPKAYRKKVRVIGEESGAPRIIEAPESPKEKVKEPAETVKKNAASKAEATWRSDYTAARATVQATEQDIADLKGRLSDRANMSRTEFLTLQSTLKQEEFKLQGQKKRAEQLREEGLKAGYSIER